MIEYKIHEGDFSDEVINNVTNEIKLAIDFYKNINVDDVVRIFKKDTDGNLDLRTIFDKGIVFSKKYSYFYTNNTCSQIGNTHGCIYRHYYIVAKLDLNHMLLNTEYSVNKINIKNLKDCEFSCIAEDEFLYI